jgi:hypothetical protein
MAIDARRGGVGALDVARSASHNSQGLLNIRVMYDQTVHKIVIHVTVERPVAGMPDRGAHLLRAPGQPPRRSIK